MVDQDLLAQIEAASKAIEMAEGDLRQLIKGIEVAPRAEKIPVGEEIQAASSKLKVAKAKLIELEQLLARARLPAAREAVAEAETYLDKVIGEIEVVAGADTTWVSKIVKDAFTNLEMARTKVSELEYLAKKSKALKRSKS